MNRNFIAPHFSERAERVPFIAATVLFSRRSAWFSAAMHCAGAGEV